MGIFTDGVPKRISDLLSQIPDDLLRQQLENVLDYYFGLEEVERVAKETLQKAKVMSSDEARFLVSAYYNMQEARKCYNMQADALAKANLPNDLISWLWQQSEKLENQIKRGLDAYTGAHPMGDWMRSIYGIGPILSGGLLANLDIDNAKVAGYFWGLAGWNGDRQKPWGEGQKRPWSRQLRTLCWNIGDSFRKFSTAMDEDGNLKCFYGGMYRKRKEYEIARNERGGNAERCVKILEKKRFRKDTEAYKWYVSGKLPPAHIDAQARRWAVKLFLSHLHEEWYRFHFKQEPPKPYAIGILGHVDYIPPPVRMAA